MFVLPVLQRAGAADVSSPRDPQREYSGSPGGTRVFLNWDQADSSSCGPQIEPLSGLLEGGTMVTISGSNLGQKVEDILHSVYVAEVPCSVVPGLYEISSRVVCRTRASGGERSGRVSVKVSGGELGVSTQVFSYQVSSPAPRTTADPPGWF